MLLEDFFHQLYRITVFGGMYQRGSHRQQKTDREQNQSGQNDDREGYDRKTGVGTRKSLGIENIRINSKDNGIDSGLDKDVNVRVQTNSNRNGIGKRSGMRLKTCNDNREGQITKYILVQGQVLATRKFGTTH